MSRICVKNLSDRIDEQQLRSHFGSRGEITDCRLVKTKSGKSRHFGFIGFRTEEQANDAIQYFNNTYLLTNKISVELADRVGNEESLKKSRSKYSQQKLKKITKEKERAHEEVEGRSLLPVGKPTKSIDKRKLDFLEAMKARRNIRVWTNDEGGRNKSEATVESDEEPSSGDEKEAVGDTSTTENLNLEEEDRSDSNAIAHSNVSDMEYLRSKVKLNAAAVAPSAPAPIYASESIDNELTSEGPPEEEFEEDRLFIRNLPYLCTEEELWSLFAVFGEITSVHLPLNEEKRSKGFGFVQFMLPESADKALNAVDGTSFQGRLLHVIKAKKVPDPLPSSKPNTKGLSSFQKQKEEDRRKLLHLKDGWNASYVRSDAVVESLADRYAMARSEILDTTESGGELAVRIAMGETHILQENREYFQKYNIDISVLESSTSNRKAEARSSTTLLVKNLPHSVVPEELEDMFSKFGSISAFLIPPSKTLAVVDFVEPSEARAAYKGLAYRKYKHLPLYLEWAPKEAIPKPQSVEANKVSAAQSTKAPVDIAEESLLVEEEYSSLFLKNLNFSTTEDQLSSHISNRGCQGLRAVSIPKKRKGSMLLSMGYGFAEFTSSEFASSALKMLNGSVLDGHAMDVKPTDKRISSKGAEKRPINSQETEKNTKIIVRNVAFQATITEIKALFSAFGIVKSVRIPKKLGNLHRGFAFVEFSSSQEANLAMNALKNTHLYGRHLVLEWAKEIEDDVDQLRKKAKVEAKSIKGSAGMQGNKRLKAAVEEEQNKGVLDADSD